MNVAMKRFKEENLNQLRKKVQFPVSNNAISTSQKHGHLLEASLFWDYGIERKASNMIKLRKRALCD